MRQQGRVCDIGVLEMGLRRLGRFVSRSGGLCFAVLLGLVGVRVLVSFLQSLAMLKSERENDTELAGLCDRNIASNSAKMRAACLSLAAESASPVLAAAMLRTASMLFEDLRTTLLAPLNGGSTIWLLFWGCLGAFAMQQMLLRWGVISPQVHGIEMNDPHSRNHVIIMRGSAGGTWDTENMGFDALRHRTASARAFKMPPLLLESGGAEGDDSSFCELSLKEASQPGLWNYASYGLGLGRVGGVKQHRD